MSKIDVYRTGTRGSPKRNSLNAHYWIRGLLRARRGTMNVVVLVTLLSLSAYAGVVESLDVAEEIAALKAEVASLRAQVSSPQTISKSDLLFDASRTKTWSSVIKSGAIGDSEEVLLMERDGAGVVNHMQWTCGDDAPTLIRVYVDGEKNASLVFDTLSELASIGFRNRAAPWGTQYFGKGATGGGVYSTRRIPFGNGIKMTAELMRDTVESYFFIARGLSGAFPLIIGDLVLPSSARLKLYKTSQALVKPLKFLTLAQTDNVTSMSGVMTEIQLSMQSDFAYLYLEACLRVFIDGNEDPTFLSSGTEDYFNSADYFDGGAFLLDQAGVTALNRTANAVSAYRMHDRDPVVFEKGIQVVWRNSENPLECPFQFPWPPPASSTSASQAAQGRLDEYKELVSRQHGKHVDVDETDDDDGLNDKMPLDVVVDADVWMYVWPMV